MTERMMALDKRRIEQAKDEILLLLNDKIIQSNSNRTIFYPCVHYMHYTSAFLDL
jgi:hypothetical protein